MNDKSVGVSTDEPKEETEDDELKEFFETVSEIKSGMGVIRNNIRAIEESYSQSLVALNVDTSISL